MYQFLFGSKIEHSVAVEYLVKILAGTQGKGVITKTTLEPSLKVHAEVDFVIKWNKSTARDDESTSKSESGFVITFANCPLLWTLKLRSQIALSTTETEYMVLLSSIRQALPVLKVIEKMR